MNTPRSTLGGILTATLALFTLLIAGTPATAQRFQHLYGDTCLESGFSGKFISTGGYISVGDTRSRLLSTGGSCTSDADVFVVKTNNDGTIAWEKIYNMGGNDVAQDVYECSNGDFAITGYSQNNNASCIGGGAQHDAFILRITAAGAVSWCKFYGTDSTKDYGLSIIEANYAQSVSVSVGDLVVAGYRAKGTTTANDEAWIFRVNGTNGAVRWSRLYGGTSLDRFYDLCESRYFGSATSLNRGDIIAAGFSTSFNVSGTNNGFIARVSGATGTFAGGAPRAAAVYGTAADTIELYSVAELAIPGPLPGNNTGTIVYSGSYKTPAGPIFGNSTDIYLLKTAANPCTFMADRRIGDNATAREVGYCIREVNLGPGSGLNDGDLYVCGLADGVRPQFMIDGFIVKVNPTNLAPVGTVHIYGSPAPEWFFKLALVPMSVNVRMAGVVAFGTANIGLGGLPTFPDPSQLWMVKTDNNLSVNCCDTIFTPLDASLNILNSCPTLTPPLSGTSCSPQVATDSIRKIDTLCNDTLNRSRTCTYPPRPRFGGSEGQPNGTAGAAEEATPAISERIISSYPNPVKVGSTLSLTYALPKGGSLRIDVSDMAGRVVASSSGTFEAGTNLIPIRTDGWVPGTYLITVRSGDRVTTTTVVVAGR